LAIIASAGPYATPSGACDPDFANVVLLNHAELQVGASVTSAVGTDLQLQGAAAVAGANPRFGSNSLSLPTAGSYSQASNSVGGPLAFGSSVDWTVECWCYISSIPSGAAVIMDRRPSFAARGLSIFVDAGTWYFVAGDSNLAGWEVSISGGTPATAVWHHIAATHEVATNTYRFFVNGVLLGSQVWAGTLDGAERDWVFGQSVPAAAPPSISLIGYLDDIRLTSGVARYTASFTPPADSFADAAC
jgi:hypothetical protein